MRLTSRARSLLAVDGEHLRLDQAIALMRLLVTEGWESEAMSGVMVSMRGVGFTCSSSTGTSLAVLAGRLDRLSTYRRQDACESPQCEFQSWRRANFGR